ncbi:MULTISPECIES: LLM class flavin-dependent oxidoreductase [Planococcus]|uniref:Luciferase family oxidoreductase n=1 Tax=Planococcus faecalis TaxID=1598147 RepID=A0ABM6IPF9_9BACL|nr:MULTISPECIES: LLM class flavin-dependent oxidoreductase [Planococcus]AQU78348.1 luciferase family oxidoreductase [Planococcus faecalis]MDJ0331851.1 LLM class flavin-dependent oxidoreductase [Planococcus sp. S3-L1]OHX52448.1 limonene 1,2-monooxygenase [Planococcus faecalis]
MVLLNVLDYSPIDEGQTASVALKQTTQLAQLAEKLGFKRFWVAEHHKVDSVAGSSPELLMMHLATSTKTIRIGSGGVMLPHYSAYKVAENFRLLEALHPERIDLGIGRSRSYRIVNEALNESKTKRLPYEQQLTDLQKYFSDDITSEHRFQALQVMPTIETAPELWLLGTGFGSARLAAEKGMSYAYAHFAKPSEQAVDVIKTYRSNFQPSVFLQQPQVIIAVFAVVAETMEQAEALATAFDLWLLFIESDSPPPYYPSIETARKRGFSASEQEKIERNRKRMLIGTAEQVKEQIEEIAERFEPDEITIIPNISGITNRMNVLRLLASAFDLSEK